jgi:hypothetical protein
MDRGYVPESLLEKARKGCILFICTSLAKATFPFAQSDSKLSDDDKRVVVKNGATMSREDDSLVRHAPRSGSLTLAESDYEPGETQAALYGEFEDATPRRKP